MFSWTNEKIIEIKNGENINFIRMKKYFIPSIIHCIRKEVKKILKIWEQPSLTFKMQCTWSSMNLLGLRVEQHLNGEGHKDHKIWASFSFFWFDRILCDPCPPSQLYAPWQNDSLRFGRLCSLPVSISLIQSLLLFFSYN